MITHQPFQGIIARDSLHIAWIKQRSVVDSIKEKCDLISHLYAVLILSSKPNGLF